MAPGSAVPAALFPGYLFVKPGDQWRALRNTRGVIDIVMMGDRPDYVAKEAFKTLRKWADKDGIVTLPKQRKPNLGERVQIKVGAWQGFEGLYDGLDDEGRQQVLFSMFGRTVTMKFKRASSIEVVDE
jgi:transcription antitermination factor NusG